MNDQELSVGSVAPVAPETKVTTVSNAVARLVFPGEARCVVGHKPTELYTRVGGYGALYTQTYGDSACKTKASSAQVFCGDPNGQCPRKMVLTGEALTSVFYSTRANVATASSAEAYARFGRVVLCSGHVRIQLPGENGSEEQVIGNSRPGMEWIVEFEESFAKAEESQGMAEAITGAFSVVGYVPAAGSCRSQVVRGFSFEPGALDQH
jgi:hypothetical protein